MASIRNEYEVTVEPSGCWRVRHVLDERSYSVSSGKELTMDEAEEAARALVANKLQELARHAEARKDCRVFTIPATIRVPR